VDSENIRINLYEDKAQVDSENIRIKLEEDKTQCKLIVRISK
jgi:hypothetical protein